MQNFTPIGCTIADISVPGQIDKYKVRITSNLMSFRVAVKNLFCTSLQITGPQYRETPSISFIEIGHNALQRSYLQTSGRVTYMHTDRRTDTRLTIRSEKSRRHFSNTCYTTRNMFTSGLVAAMSTSDIRQYRQYRC